MDGLLSLTFHVDMGKMPLKGSIVPNGGSGEAKVLKLQSVKVGV